MIILALDLATVSGFARGDVGDVPEHGSIRFAKEGASHAAVFGRALEWLIEQTTGERRPEMIIYEAPLLPKWGKTNIDTTQLLQGLPAIVEAVAFMRGIHNRNLRRINVKKVRGYFIGREDHDRKRAKNLTVRKCKLMGWEPVDDNAADALALWSYQCALIDPRTSIKTMPLFMREVA